MNELIEKLEEKRYPAEIVLSDWEICKLIPPGEGLDLYDLWNELIEEEEAAESP